jgi:hypothetical protein
MDDRSVLLVGLQRGSRSDPRSVSIEQRLRGRGRLIDIRRGLALEEAL